MHPNHWEKESKRVAEFLVYINQHFPDIRINDTIRKAADEYYGDQDKVHIFTERLCEACEKIPDSFIYDGRRKTSRALADWWEQHQAADLQKRKEEENKIKRLYSEIKKL